jgi:hypothetical protein
LPLKRLQIVLVHLLVFGEFLRFQLALFLFGIEMLLDLGLFLLELLDFLRLVGQLLLGLVSLKNNGVGLADKFLDGCFKLVDGLLGLFLLPFQQDVALLKLLELLLLVSKQLLNLLDLAHLLVDEGDLVFVEDHLLLLFVVVQLQDLPLLFDARVDVVDLVHDAGQVNELEHVNKLEELRLLLYVFKG